MVHIIETITYPHYKDLPEHLRHNLNILRTNLFEYVEGSCEVSCTIDHNDIEFLSLELLVEWIKEYLPDYDCDFLEAASRLHEECYDEQIFECFAVDEKDLFEELLYVKDAYELKQTLSGE